MCSDYFVHSRCDSVNGEITLRIHIHRTLTGTKSKASLH